MTHVLICAAAFTASWTATAVGGFNVVDYLLAVTTLCLVGSWILRRRVITLSWWIFLPSFAALLVSAYAVIFSGDETGSVTAMVRIFVSTAVIALVLSSIRDTQGEHSLERTLRCWAAGIATNALAAIAVSLDLVDFTGVLNQPTGLRLSGLSSHPNSLAFSITIAIPVLVYLIFSSSRLVTAAFWTLLMGVCMWALFLADSRSGLLVSIPTFATALVLVLWNSRIRFLAAPMLTLAGIVIALVIPSAISETRLAQGSEQSDAGRLIYNENAFTTFTNNAVFGGGFAAQAGVAVPLIVLSAGGVVLFVGYYLYVLWPLPSLWQARRDRLAQMGLLCLVAFLCFGFLNPVFVERATFWPILIALYCTQLQTHDRSAPNDVAALHRPSSHVID